MRNMFVNQLEIFAEQDDRIIILVGDIGFGVFENFERKHPNQFINMGIAEQNMIGVASGLAKEGFKPVIYTIIPFLTMRAFEQIRVDLCMHGRNVLLVGVGGGFSYDILGPTHHALEDIAIMRALPQMQIYTPGTPNQVKTVFKEIIETNAPRYLRLGKNGENELKSETKYFKELGIFKCGGDTSSLIISHGPIAYEVEKARLEILKKYSYDLAHYMVVRNEPISQNLFNDIFSNYESIFVVEETYATGGLLSEILQKAHELKKNNLEIIGLHAPKKFYSRVATRSEILSDLNLDHTGIYKFLEKSLNDRVVR